LSNINNIILLRFIQDFRQAPKGNTVKYGMLLPRKAIIDNYTHTWLMPSLSRRSERRRHEYILRKVLIQRNCEYRQCNCTTQELSFQWHRRSPGQRFV